MAAVLCSTFGELLKGCCDGFGKVITLPCRACGCACSSISEIVTSSFFPYLALTFCLNMPGLVYGFMGLTSGCANSSWLLGNAVLSVIHMLGAMYIVNKIRETPSSALANPIHNSGDTGAPVTDYGNFSIPKENEQGAANSFSRIKHVLCYDKTMAVYIIIFIGWIVWLSVGITKRLSVEDGGDCDKYMNVTISCGYMYLSFVFMAFGCSLCCLR